MKVFLSFVFLLVFQGLSAKEGRSKTVYDFKVKDIDANEVDMSTYRGKLLLIVNVASQCGFTKQYAGLERLYRKYKDKGLVVMGFPCNQFGGQEPGSAEEIKVFCKENYDVSFPLFSKVEVNGDNALELYKFLKEEQKGSLGTTSIKWNFTKFLVNREGKPIERFGSAESPEEIESEIIKHL